MRLLNSSTSALNHVSAARGASSRKQSFLGLNVELLGRKVRPEVIDGERNV